MKKYGWAALIAFAAIGCDRPTTAPAPLVRPAADIIPGTGTAVGYKIYQLQGAIPVESGFNVKQTNADESASGPFRIHFEDSGYVYDIRGEATCLAIDGTTGRAWIGGVVTRNTTTDPAFQTPIHKVGRDVWFRILDIGENPGVDRTSFFGFEGAVGIKTSKEYCNARLWPADNARTWPVTYGYIRVR